ncbi:unnamed protein product [Camellia sinensis]
MPAARAKSQTQPWLKNVSWVMGSLGLHSGLNPLNSETHLGSWSLRSHLSLLVINSDHCLCNSLTDHTHSLPFSLFLGVFLNEGFELVFDCETSCYLIGAFKPACNISITFSDGKTRKKVPMKKENGQTVMIPLFQSQENIAGKISIEPVQGKKVEHNGIKIELLGQIVRELDVPGEIYERKTYPFEFSTVEMPYETYNGVNVRLRYVLKVTISRGYAGSIVEYQDFVRCYSKQLNGKRRFYLTGHKQLGSSVRNYGPPPSINNSIKMEVGIEDCLHIEFEYNNSKYHLKDVIIGKIYFLLIRIKIKNMDLEIRRRESTGSGANTHVETETLAKFELMDGAPVRGESIPIRLFLSPYELTPTHRNINNKFSVKYYLNLVLVDEEDRRYFKQQEITIYRQAETS